MELRHLRYFIAVADALSFTKAAQQLHIAQPPLSRQIGELEEEVRVRLFLRSRRGVQLTGPGRVFLESARKVLEQARQAVDMAQKAQREGVDFLTIGIGMGLGEQVNRALVLHAKRFPGVEVQCRDIISERQNAALLEGTIEVGFMRPPVDPVQLESELIFHERLLVVLPKKHPLAGSKSLTLKQLANERLLLHDRDLAPGVYDKTLTLYRAAGVNPNVVPVRVGPHEEAGAILVAAGKGIYLGVGGAVSHPVFGRQITAIPLDERGATIGVYMVWRKGESADKILAFLQSARSVFKARRKAQ